MPKGIQKRGSILIALLLISGCSKQNQNSPSNNGTPIVDTSAETAPALTNCHFQNQTPNYTFNSTIQPNPIVCGTGIPRTVQVLSPAPLPAGLAFNPTTLSLEGTPSQKLTQAPYKFYIENETGYVIIDLQITVQ